MSAKTPAAKMVASTRTSITGRLRDVFRNQRGAVDLPSIMVGAIVLGLLTAAILATVFTVIPWAQDNAAKQKVSQIVSSQSVYYAMSTDGSATGVGTDPQYASVHDLVDENLLAGITKGAAPTSAGTAPNVTETSLDSLNKIRIATTNATAAGAGNDTFTAWVRSDTGNVYKANESAPQPDTGAWGVR